MTNDMAEAGGRRWSRWRIVGWSIPALLLLLPLVAMQFTTEIAWSGGDFLFAAVVFGTIGLAFEFIVGRSGNLAYRLGAAFAVFASFFIVWVNAAVGMIGAEENGYNLLFLAAIAVALAGGIPARFRAAGLARATVGAAIVQGAVAAGGFSQDPRGAVLSMALALLWLIAAAFFRAAARTGQGSR